LRFCQFVLVVGLQEMQPGTDVMILKIFSKKKNAFLTKNKSKLGKIRQILDHNIGL
jgi:hypothetical protein